MDHRTTLPRRTLRALAAAAALLLSMAAAPAGAGSDSIDSDLMQSLEDHQKDLASNLGLADARAATANADELLRGLREVQAWYEARPALAEGVELSRKAVEHATRVRQQIGHGDLGGAAASATDLGRSCKACHTVFKKDS
jgi:hypothetical protein